MASSLRSLLLLAALALVMSSVLCARLGLREYGRPLPKPAPTPKLDRNEDVLVQRLLNFTTLKYNLMSNETHLRRPLRLLSTRKETVTATNYFLEVEIGKTTCTRDEAKKYEWFTCPFDEKKEKRRCHFMLYHKTWLNETRLMSTSCYQNWIPDVASRP